MVTGPHSCRNLFLYLLRTTPCHRLNPSPGFLWNADETAAICDMPSRHPFYCPIRRGKRPPSERKNGRTGQICVCIDVHGRHLRCSCRVAAGLVKVQWVNRFKCIRIIKGSSKDYVMIQAYIVIAQCIPPRIVFFHHVAAITIVVRLAGIKRNQYSTNRHVQKKLDDK